MGGDTKSPVWNLRITMNERRTKSVIMNFLHAWDIAKLACWEKATSEHTHIALVGVDIVRSTIVRRLKSQLPDISGNADFSLTLPKDGEDVAGLYRYICKGTGPDWNGQGPDIIHNRNSLDTKAYHTDYWTKQEAFKEEVKTLAKKREKNGIKEKTKIISELAIAYKGKTVTPPVILSIVSDVITAYKGNVNDNTLFTAVQAIAWEADPVQTCSQAGQRMLRKIFPQY